jgi:hypothetical protein
MADQEYRNVSGHPEDLEGGRVVGNGEAITLTDEQLKDARVKELIDTGKFTVIDEPPADPPEQPDRKELMARAKELEIDGDLSKMKNPELHSAIIQAEQAKEGGNG